ncbi:hypothetical protein EW146_g294 [Bondarzewia mesenterica]|uniref:Uncharacterized protein n=1 Tax=Bondarzewia mesenterica TaxID=1095465 RepID=A0A4S4M7W8_9AGAM|nr:hypothetical protein EW146_g294 [Bondarzewia mesenterica]
MIDENGAENWHDDVARRIMTSFASSPLAIASRYRHSHRIKPTAMLRLTHTKPTETRLFITSAKRNMPSSNPDATNAAGLKPAESQALHERSAEPHEERIVQSLKEMYSCKPKNSTYDIYTSDAVFHDPVGIARGVNSIRAQFDALPKLFSHADIQKFRILANPPSGPPNTMLVDQDVAYYRSANSSPFKTVNSLLTLRMNDSHQVTSHTEEWDHKRETTSQDGFFGLLNEQRKKFTAGLTDMMMGKGL